MPGVSCDNDTAGGDLIPSQGTVKVVIQVHGPPPHTPQTITAVLNSTVKIGGIAVVVAGDTADVCGEAATGSANVSIG